MQTIAIVDYGMGNVRSVQKALEYVAPNDECILTNNPKVIRDSDRVVFPGQGAMGSCMRALESNDLISEIKLSSESKPFLGICLGLQLLFGYSEENNGTNGLSIVPGGVIKFNNKAKNWFDKVFVDDFEFNYAREKFIRGKKSAMKRDQELGRSID